MPKRLQHSDLPAWFDLAKYQAATTLGAAGWVEQLSIRAELKTWLEEDGHLLGESPSGAVREYHGLNMAALTALRENPFRDFRTDDSLRVHFLLSMDGAESQPRSALGVRRLTTHEFYLYEAMVDANVRDYSRRYFAHVFENAPAIRDPLSHPGRAKFLSSIDAAARVDSQWATVRVDLTLPDRLLQDQLLELLSELRKASEDASLTAPKPFRLDFAGWLRFGVLPYIDLTLWAIQNRKRISNRVMADAIFSRWEAAGEEVVRKTTAGLAKKLLSPGYLRFLEAVAAGGKAESPESQ